MATGRASVSGAVAGGVVTGESGGSVATRGSSGTCNAGDGGGVSVGCGSCGGSPGVVAAGGAVVGTAAGGTGAILGGAGGVTNVGGGGGGVTSVGGGGGAVTRLGGVSSGSLAIIGSSEGGSPASHCANSAGVTVRRDFGAVAGGGRGPSRVMVWAPAVLHDNRIQATATNSPARCLESGPEYVAVFIGVCRVEC